MSNYIQSVGVFCMHACVDAGVHVEPRCTSAPIQYSTGACARSCGACRARPRVYTHHVYVYVYVYLCVYVYICIYIYIYIHTYVYILGYRILYHIIFVHIQHYSTLYRTSAPPPARAGKRLDRIPRGAESSPGEARYSILYYSIFYYDMLYILMLLYCTYL